MSRPSPAIAATLVQVSSRSDDLRDVILRFVILIAAIPLVAAQADTASAQFVGFYRGPIYPYGVGAWNYPYYGRSLSYGRGWGNRMVGTALSSNEFGMAQNDSCFRLRESARLEGDREYLAGAIRGSWEPYHLDQRLLSNAASASRP